LLSEIKMEKEFLPIGREIAGVVLEIGEKVSFFQPHDEVVGILPLDSEESGLCEVIVIHEHYLVHKPEKVSWPKAVGTIRDGVRAYTALHYLSYVSPEKTVLIMDGASPFGTIAIQLAQHRGAKVISTVYSLEDKEYLERLMPSLVQGLKLRKLSRFEFQFKQDKPIPKSPSLLVATALSCTEEMVGWIYYVGHFYFPPNMSDAHIIDESNGKYDLTESCLEETGGLGVDIILDAGGQ
ncbi:UNVERIFIED_CONTAM: hypothetical protein K2H54_055726, partial [Gekko kuhli]